MPSDHANTGINHKKTSPAINRVDGDDDHLLETEQEDLPTSQPKSGTSAVKSAAAETAFRLFLLDNLNFVASPDFPDLLVEHSCARTGATALIPITAKAFFHQLNAMLDTFTAGDPDAYLDRYAYEDVLAFLRAKAPARAKSRPAFKRIGWLAEEQELLIDLARDDNVCVRVTAGGWSLEEPLHPLFVRFPSQRPLPLPEPVMDGEAVWRRMMPPGVSEKDAKLLLGAVLACYFPSNFAASFAFPAVVLTGDAGAGKSSLARNLKVLIDNEATTVATKPKSVDDLFVDAQHSHLLSYDNLDFVNHGLSDGLCQLLTGGAVSKRTLYTNSDRTILKGHNPVLLNGIVVDIPKQDLLDRSVHIRLKRIKNYDPHAADRAQALLPEVMGHICDLLVRVVRNFHTTKVDDAPRLNLLAKIAAAAEPFGAPIQYVDLLRTNQHEALLASRDNDLVIAALFDLLRSRPHWHGTYKQLLADLTTAADDVSTRSSEWPATPHKLASHMRRHAQLMSAQGIAFENGNKVEHGRLVTVRRLPSCVSTGDPEIPF